MMLNVFFGNDVLLLSVLGWSQVLQIPRNVKAGDFATVNDSLERDDVVNLHTGRAL